MKSHFLVPIWCLPSCGHLLATVLTLGTMLILNPRMTLAVLPLIPVFILTRKHFRNRLERDSETVQQNQVAWSSFLQEHLSSIVAIQLLRRERRQERTAFHLLGTSVRSLTRLFRTGVSFTFYTSLTIGLAMAAVIGYGGWSVLAGTLTVGGLVAFYTYLAQLFEPLSGVAETYARAQKTFASIRRVQAVLALEPAIKVCRTAIKFPENRPWTIHLADVRFGYPRSDGLLCIPRLEIPAGEHVAIVGENGAGKSTLAKLIARLYDVDSGSISVAGQDVREIEIESLREQVCYVPPHPVLFDTTLAGNLRLGKGTASEAELKEVVDYVGLANWVRRLTRRSQPADRSRRAPTLGRSTTARGDRQSNPTATSHPDPGRSHFFARRGFRTTVAKQPTKNLAGYYDRRDFTPSIRIALR